MAAKVSVIVPNYNHAPYLSHRLDSIIKQSYKDIEIVLMDDCSQDNSRDILLQYAALDPRIRICFNDVNSGSTFKQWNKGISLSKGEYIWIAESDDVADISFLEKLVRILDDNPTVGMAYAQSWRMDEQGALHGTWQWMLDELDPSLWQDNFVVPGSELVHRFMAYRNIIPNASAVLMRKTALDKVGPADETKKVVGDWIFWNKYLITTDAAFVAEPLNYFRFHAKNVRSRTEADGTQILETVQMLQNLKQISSVDEQTYVKAINFILERWMHAWVYYPVTPERHKEIYAEFLKLEKAGRRKIASYVFNYMVNKRFRGLKIIVGDKLLKRHL